MSSAFIALADDATAASWNPAGLIQLEKPELSVVVTATRQVDDFGTLFSEEKGLTSEVGKDGFSEYNLNYFSAFNTPLDGKPSAVHFSGWVAAKTGNVPRTFGDTPLPTLDVLIADEIGTSSRFRSLDLSSTGSPRDSYTFRNSTSRNAADVSPLAFYQRVFGAGFVDPNQAGSLLIVIEEPVAPAAEPDSGAASVSQKSIPAASEEDVVNAPSAPLSHLSRAHVTILSGTSVTDQLDLTPNPDGSFDGESRELPAGQYSVVIEGFENSSGTELVAQR